LGKKFANVHSGSHLYEMQRQRKDTILAVHSEVKKNKVNKGTPLDMEFTIQELETAIEGHGYTAPGQDKLCYAMFRQLPEEALKMILKLLIGFREE